MSYKILFLGGTRFFGKEIVELLTREGHEVTFFTRGLTPFSHLKEAHFQGDRTREEDIRKVSLFKNWDIVIDNICFDSKAIELSIKHFKNLKQYILTSTVSVYRYSQSPTESYYRESDIDFSWKPPQENLKDPHWQYAYGKKEAEKKLLEAKAFPFTIFRLSMVHGPNDPTKRVDWYIEKMKKGETIPIANHGNFQFQFTYSKDLPGIYSESLKNNHVKNQIFNVAAEGTTTLEKLLNQKSRELRLSFKARIDSIQEDSLHGPLSYQRNWLLDTNHFQKTFASALTPLRNFI